MIRTITYKEKTYPAYESEGFAAQYAFPYAQKVCSGVGIDVGCGKYEWIFPGAFPVDTSLNAFEATDFPYANLDYIFSSHCLEHLQCWVAALDYWTSKLKRGGVLFLYLPHYSQEYWRPWHNRKHLHAFTPDIIEDYMVHAGYINVFKSGVDLNHSFMIFGEKNCE